MSIDNESIPKKLIINPTLSDTPQSYDLVIESVANSKVNFEDTIMIEITEYIEFDLSDILEETQLPPYLVP